MTIFVLSHLFCQPFLCWLIGQIDQKGAITFPFHISINMSLSKLLLADWCIKDKCKNQLIISKLIEMGEK